MRDAEDAGRLVDLACESGRVGLVWCGDGDVVELVGEGGRGGDWGGRRIGH